MVWFILSFWPVIPGYFAVCALWPTRTQLMSHFGLKCALGTILGLGGASLLYFATMCAYGSIFGVWTTNLLVVLLFYALLMGLKNRIPRATQILWCLCITLFLILCGYGLIFVLTPMNLQEHLDSTSFRFFIQVYPSLFLTYFLMIATLEETIPSHNGDIKSRVT
ncbi:MAG: hypothetical protein V1899_03915 [Planctomycetota bacterium]